MCCQSGERAMQRRPAALSLPGGPDQPPPEAAIALTGSPAAPPRPLHFAGRNSQPEIFTFDLQALPPGATPAAQPGSRRPASRRPRRVLYPPPQSRRHRPGPPEERSPALRWLYLLCLLVFLQVCLEEAEVGEGEAASSRAAVAAPAPQASPSLALQQLQAQVHAPSLHRGMLELEAASLPGNLTCQALRGLIAVTL